MKNKIKIIFFLMVVGQYVGAQVYPYNFTVDSTNFDSMFMPFQMKIGGNIRNYKVPLENLKTHINEGATTYTAAQILDSLLTVDGAGSGLDADLLDGQSGAYYLDFSNATNTAQVVEFADTATVIATKTDVANAGSGISGLTQNYIPKSNAAGNNIVNSQVFDSGTNVGIGTANPISKLHVSGGDLFCFNTGGNPRFLFGDGPSIGDYGGFRWDSSNKSLGISATNDLDFLLLNSSSQLLINTEFPQSETVAIRQSAVFTAGNHSVLLAASGHSVSASTRGVNLGYYSDGTSAVSATIQSHNNSSLLINRIGGNVGIATTSPSEKLHVTGNIRFSGALMPNNSAGTSGQKLTSAGPGAPPTWTTSTEFANGGNSFSGTATLGTNDNNPLVFETVNAERMRIATNGTIDFTNNIGGGVSGDVMTIDGNLPSSTGVYRGVAIQGGNSNIARFAARYEGTAGDFSAVLYSTGGGTMNASPGLVVDSNNDVSVAGEISAASTDFPDTVFLTITPLGLETQLSGTGDILSDYIVINDDLAGYTLSEIYYNVYTAGSGTGNVQIRTVIDDLARTARHDLGTVSYGAGEIEKQNNPAQALEKGDIILIEKVADTIVGKPEGLTATYMLTK